MPVYSNLYSSEVKRLLNEKYEQIKTHSTSFNQNVGYVVECTFTLVDESERFHIDRFISLVSTILIRFKINFGISFVLKDEVIGLRYFHQSHNNSRLLPQAFLITGPTDLVRFKTEFLRGNWLELNTHAKLRPTTKTRAVCITSVTFYVYLIDRTYQFVGAPLNDLPKYFTNSMSLYTLATNTKNKKYKDNLCFFRNVICAKSTDKKFKPQKIKMDDVKALYATLRENMPELPLASKQFRGFDRESLNKACGYLKVNAYIFNCDLSNGGINGAPGCLDWRSDVIEDGIRINMLEYENHLMYIKDLKCLFNQYECSKCRRCFDHVSNLDQHVPICNGGLIKHI